MNKKFLSAILFGALMVTSTGTFVSCKDYDDDIENLQGQISANASAIAELKALIQNGDYVTNVALNGSNLVVTFKNAGPQTLALPECESGSKAEIKGDELYIDGEATGIKVDAEFQEAVKIVEGEWAVLQEDGTYKSTGIKASSIAVSGDEQSGYTLTVTDAEGTATAIKLPTAATLISEIEFLTTNYQQVLVDPALVLYYWDAAATSQWAGPKGNIPSNVTTYAVDYASQENTLRNIRISPASVDASAIDFKLVDTKDVETAVTLKASRYDGTLTRAAGESGLYDIKVVKGLMADGGTVAKIEEGFKTGNNFKALALKPASANYKSLFNVKVTPNKTDYKNLGNIYFGTTIVTPVGTNLTTTPSGVRQVYVGSKVSVSVTNEYALYDMYLSASAEDVALFGLEFSEDGRSFKATKSPDNVTDATIDLFVHTLPNAGGNGNIQKTTITVEFNRTLGAQGVYEKQTILPTKLDQTHLVAADVLKTSLGDDLNAWYASVDKNNIAVTIYKNEACNDPVATANNGLSIAMHKDNNNATGTLASELNYLKMMFNLTTATTLEIGKTYYAKATFKTAAGKTLNSVVIPFELTKPELETFMVKEPGVFVEGGDLAHAYLYHGDAFFGGREKAYSIYYFDRAFTDLTAKLSAAKITDAVFAVKNDVYVPGTDKTTSNYAVVDNTVARQYIQLNETDANNDGLYDGYKKDLNVVFTAKLLGVTNSTWCYKKAYQFRVMSPILEGTALAKNNMVEVSATGKTQITGEDIWAKTYNGDVTYGIFKTTVKNANAYVANWSRNDISKVEFTTGNKNIFEVTTAQPTAPEFKTETGEITKASFIEVEGVAAGEAKLNVAVTDIWGYTLKSQVDIKATVNTGN